MSWSEIEFENLYQVPSKNGLTRPARVRGAGYKMINMGELFANDRIGDIEMELVPMNDKELDTMLVEEGDLLFARQSLVLAGAGKCSIVKNIEEPTTFESHIIRVRLNRKRAYPPFYYYYFKSPTCRIKSIVIQGVQAGIRGNDLKKLKVHAPDLNTQVRASEMLGTYDDIIENNKRRIELLEESARQLYKEWFVRFRFPGHEHVKIIDGVPEGWERQVLSDVLTLNYGKALKADNRIDGPYPVYGSSGVIGSHNKALVKGPGIIVGRKGNVGSVFWSEEDFYPIDTVYFINSTESSYFIYFSLISTPFISTDVAVPGLNRNFAYSRKLLIPSNFLRNEFEDEVQPLFDQIRTLHRYNIKLAEARDLLLPKLMRGVIAV